MRWILFLHPRFHLIPLLKPVLATEVDPISFTRGWLLPWKLRAANALLVWQLLTWRPARKTKLRNTVVMTWGAEEQSCRFAEGPMDAAW